MGRRGSIRFARIKKKHYIIRKKRITYRHTQCGPLRKYKSKLMLFEIVIFENGIENCDEGQDSWASWNSAFLIRQEIHCVYGDPANPLGVRLQAPFRTGHLTADQENFNSSIIKFRSSVECIFSDITSYFTFLDFKKNLKIDLSPVCTIYSVCGLLRNALTCFYGSSTSAYFDFPSPSIQEYFHF